MNEISERKNAYARLNEAYVNLNNLYQQAVKDTAKKFADLVEFYSVATWDENGFEMFSISVLGLKEILRENFGVEVE